MLVQRIESLSSFNGSNHSRSFNGWNHFRSFNESNHFRSFNGWNHSRSFNGSNHFRSFNGSNQSRSFNDAMILSTPLIQRCVDESIPHRRESIPATTHLQIEGRGYWPRECGACGIEQSCAVRTRKRCLRNVATVLLATIIDSQASVIVIPSGSLVPMMATNGCGCTAKARGCVSGEPLQQVYC
jgi:hypothetical protein